MFNNFNRKSSVVVLAVLYEGMLQQCRNNVKNIGPTFSRFCIKVNIYNYKVLIIYVPILNPKYCPCAALIKKWYALFPIMLTQTLAQHVINAAFL